jgi:glycerophosphoryl diester phosphodiesterase
LWGHDRPLSRLTHAALTELTSGGVPTLSEALAALDGHRVMLDLPGADEAAVRAITASVRDCGAEARVYYCGGLGALTAVRAAARDAEIALTWTTLAPPRPVLLEMLRPRWLNYRFGLVSRELADRVHADGLLLSAWTADTRRTMRALVDRGVDSITTNRVATLASVLRAGRAGTGEKRHRA